MYNFLIIDEYLKGKNIWCVKGPLKLQKLDQSLTGEVVFTSAIFSNNRPIQSQNSQKHREFSLLYPQIMSTPHPPPSSIICERMSSW